MKRVKLTVTALFVTIAMTSCYRILDQEPTDRYSDATMWSDPTLIDQYLAGLYACTPVMINDAVCIMPSAGGSRANVDNNDWGYCMGFSAGMEGPVRTIEITDEAKYNFGAQGNLIGVKFNGFQLNDDQLAWWGNAYYTIRNINDFIDKVSPDVQDAEIKIAEARFLRAYNYFAMVKRYGGVPLITKVVPLHGAEEDIYPSRETEQRIYDFILKETEDITKILPDKAEAGKASKWAAYALRSRAALYAGSIARYGKMQLDGLLGIPVEQAETYFKICYDACDSIMKKSPHRLYDANPDKVQNFKDIFLIKDNCEAIMVQRHSGGGYQSSGGDNLWSWDMCECPRPNVWGIGNYHGPYLEMVEEFETKDAASGKACPLDRGVLQNNYTTKAYSIEELWGDRDPRFAASIWTTGTEWPGAIGGVMGTNRINMQQGIWTRENTVLDGRNDVYEDFGEKIAAIGDQVVRFKESNEPNTGFGVMKYLDPNANNMEWFGESTTDYLIFRYAEILLNYAEAAFELNKPNDAKDAINQIRTRAGIAPLEGNITMDQIRHERKVELAFENHRYWDLRRWRIAHKVLTRSPNSEYGPYTGIRYIYDVAQSKSAGEPKFRLYFESNIDRRSAYPTFPEKNYYFPIGQSRRATNPNLVPNPGYE